MDLWSIKCSPGSSSANTAAGLQHTFDPRQTLAAHVILSVNTLRTSLTDTRRFNVGAAPPLSPKLAATHAANQANLATVSGCPRQVTDGSPGQSHPRVRATGRGQPRHQPIGTVRGSTDAEQAERLLKASQSLTGSTTSCTSGGLRSSRPSPHWPAACPPPSGRLRGSWRWRPSGTPAPTWLQRPDTKPAVAEDPPRSP